MSLLVGRICRAAHHWRQSSIRQTLLNSSCIQSSVCPSSLVSSQNIRSLVSLHCTRNLRNILSKCDRGARSNSGNAFVPFVIASARFHGLSAGKVCVCRQTDKTHIRKVLWRLFSEQTKHSKEDIKKRTQSLLLYVLSTGVLMLGASYAGVPLYKMFCQAMGIGGQVSQTGHKTAAIESMERVSHRQITVEFNADVGAAMRWQFRPQQTKIKVVPGETALVFYTATNPTDKPIIGISTYSVVPYQAANYFNKIQCFCFEEQILNPFEKVDMPVFFYIDPEFDEDPAMENVDNILLSYTFFEAKEGMTLPYPGFQQPQSQPQPQAQ